MANGGTREPAIDIDEVVLCTQARAKRVILVMQFQLDSVKSAACARYSCMRVAGCDM